MKLTSPGISSADCQRPIFYSAAGGTYVVQGWKITAAESLAQLDIPKHETAADISPELLGYVPHPSV